MEFREYQKKAMRTKAEYMPGQQLLCAVMGIAGEAGELVEMVKKARYQGHDLSDADLVNESGDILWYIALLCDAIGADMSGVAAHNIRKLEERYPNGFEVERSKNREVKL